MIRELIGLMKITYNQRTEQAFPFTIYNFDTVVTNMGFSILFRNVIFFLFTTIKERYATYFLKLIANSV